MGGEEARARLFRYDGDGQHDVAVQTSCKSPNTALIARCMTIQI